MTRAPWGARRRWPRLTALWLVAFATMAAGCAKNAPQDVLDPAGPAARSIDRLQRPVFMVAAIIFVIVQGLLLLIVFKYRHRPGQAEPVQIHGSTKLEFGWTIAPALILLVVAVPTVAKTFDLARTPPNAIEVTVTGHQWWWEYRYPQFNIVTANELFMPTDRPVELTLKATDVIHSFWVPRLGGKQDVVPGRTHRMSLKGETPGTYQGQCAEFCGLSHANMRLRAVVQTPEDFDAWVRGQQQAAAPAPPNTPAAEGATLFTQKGCGGCHTVQGVSRGTLGPNLTHLFSRGTFAGSMFDVTPANLRRWLRDPPAVKPGSKMPNLGLSPDEIDKLMAYLETLK